MVPATSFLLRRTVASLQRGSWLVQRYAASHTIASVFRRKTAREAVATTTFSPSPLVAPATMTTVRTNFSFTGPKRLEEILKTDMIRGKSAEEVSALWTAYHEDKERTFARALSSDDAGRAVLERAARCPFLVQPVFREGGFFTLLSQFQDPCHFFLAYLEDYREDPNRAQPLVSFSVFPELADDVGVHLMRCEVIHKGVDEAEGLRAAESVLDMYAKDEEFEKVIQFNERPAEFDVDDYISYQNRKWNDEVPATTETTTK